MTEHENIQAVSQTTERFEIRKKDHAIIDNEREIGAILVEMNPTEDGSESQYTDRASVLSLLNRLDYKANHQAVDLTVIDGILNVERKLIMLEHIIEDMDFIARTNFAESDSYPRRRDYQYLMEIQKHYKRLFDDAYAAINQVRKGLK